MHRKWIAAGMAVLLAVLLAGCQKTQAEETVPTYPTGWEDTEHGRVYWNADGMQASGWQEIQGQRYYFDAAGNLATGWQELPEGIFCFREDGTVLTGWAEKAGSRFYLKEDGCAATGEAELDGVSYLFREDGAMHTGWLETEEGRFYYHPDGSRAAGWTEVEQRKYLFDENGLQLTGWQEWEEYRLYFLEDGSPAQGPVEIEGETFHFTPEGIQVWLVNPWNKLPENYEVELAVSEGGYRVAEDCVEALGQMILDCRAEGLAPVLYSGFRTYWDQHALYQAMIAQMGSAAAASTIVAVPDTSEHQLGYAVDIVAETYRKMDYGQSQTKVQQWLMEHCWDYGFILRYPEGTTEVTGIIYEPWHYRYVGVYLAKILQENGMTLEEYLGAVEG